MSSHFSKFIAAATLILASACTEKPYSGNAFGTTILNGFSLSKICIDFRERNNRYPTIAELESMVKVEYGEGLPELFENSSEITESRANDGGWRYLQREGSLTIDSAKEFQMGYGGVIVVPNEIEFLHKPRCPVRGVPSKAAREFERTRFFIFRRLVLPDEETP